MSRQVSQQFFEGGKGQAPAGEMDLTPLDKAPLAEERLHFAVFTVGVGVKDRDTPGPGPVLGVCQQGGGHAAALERRVHRHPVDDQGRAMECSSDPMLDALQTQLAGVTLGDPASLGDRLGPVLSNPVLFGCDLTALGLGKRIEGMVREMLSGPGAVRETLKKYLKS